MDYQVSARKYRPGTFDDVIGQPQVVQALTNAVSSKRIAHAFLFSGTRGVGKTTVARVLAKALNCEGGLTGHPCGACVSCTEIAHGTSVDVVEIDGASNTSVDDVREIRENAKFTPFRGSYRVYIIDEVHMLSNSAFNALLKILEEPPAHVVFIFATTELHKIPATILSRCQHYTFRRLSRGEIIARLEHIAAQDDIRIEGRSLALLARASEGSMRDGLSLFDQAVALCGSVISHNDLETLLGAVPQEHVHAMLEAIRAQDSRHAVQVIADLLDCGQDLRAFCGEMVEHLRNLLVAAVVSSAHDLRGLIEASGDDLDQLHVLAKQYTPEQLQEFFRLYSQAEDAMRLSLHPRFTLEVASIRATRVGSMREVRQADGTAVPTPPSQTGVSGRREGAAPVATTATAAKPTLSKPPSAGAGRAVSGRPPGTPEPRKPMEPAARPAASPAPRDLSRSGVQPGRNPKGEDMGPTTSASVTVPTPRVTVDWEECLARVAEAHPSVAPFLEMGQCTGIEGNEITIGYTKTASVARAMMEKVDNLQAIRAVCERLAGQSVRIRVVEVSETEVPGPTMAQVRAARERDEKLVLFEQTRAHPFIKETLETFGGELVEVRRLASEQEAKST